jgi:hypothetical protein
MTRTPDTSPTKLWCGRCSFQLGRTSILFPRDAMQASFDELRQEIKKIRGGLTGEMSDLPNPRLLIGD